MTYDATGQYLFDIVILVHRYERHKVSNIFTESV